MDPILCLSQELAASSCLGMAPTTRHHCQAKPGPSPPIGALSQWSGPEPSAVPGPSGQRPARAGISRTQSGLPLAAPSVKGEREFPLKFNSSKKLLTKKERRSPSPRTWVTLLSPHIQRDRRPWGTQHEGVNGAAVLADTPPWHLSGWVGSRHPHSWQGYGSNSPSKVHLKPCNPPTSLYRQGN